MQKIGYIDVTGVIHCLSGNRIGGSDELLQIGGTDLTCIKHPVTLQPYIPGSSFKGKMRSELEKKLGRISGNKPCGCATATCIVCRVFGPHANTQHSLGPTRIIVRDCQPIGAVATERKSSTAIDRVTGAGLRGSLRTEERVVAGSKFSLKIVLQVWDLDSQCEYPDQSNKGGEALFAFLKDGLREVQMTGLGSGVSKGSGEIEFLDLKRGGGPFDLK